MRPSLSPGVASVDAEVAGASEASRGRSAVRSLACARRQNRFARFVLERLESIYGTCPASDLDFGQFQRTRARVLWLSRAHSQSHPRAQTPVSTRAL